MFRVLAKALDTDDGRRIVSDCLRGQLASRPHVPISPDLASDAPYPELGARRRAAPPLHQPVFVTARFRSGSTLLWNIFRHVSDCTSFYEPLNERRWFDPSARGDRVDETHLGVSDYWREYSGLERLGAFYRQEWIERHLYMDPFFWDPDLASYIAGLISAAPGRAVLQFNRVDFRLPWLRRVFPHARLIHLYRHPRDQWCSSLVDIRAFPKEAPLGSFAAHDHFYLLNWAKDLRYHFPFLDAKYAEHPYRLFYWIWKLSYLFGRTYADDSFCFEELVSRPGIELDRLMRTARVEHYDLTALEALVAQQKLGKWTQYADDSWFTSHESYCEDVLADYFRAAESRSV